MNLMLMASRTLASRIERAECDTVQAFAERLRESGGDVRIRAIGDGAAILPDRTADQQTRRARLGGREETLEQIEHQYDNLGEELRVELATLADPAAGILLTRRGYELVGYENVLGLPFEADVVDGLALARESDTARGIR